MRIYINIFISFFIMSYIYSDSWSMTITAVDEQGIGSSDYIVLEMCDQCNDWFHFGEDEYDYPDPFSGEFTNIHFFHLDWYGQQDENGNICNQTKFSSDFRSIHQNYDLLFHFVFLQVFHK